MRYARGAAIDGDADAGHVTRRASDAKRAASGCGRKRVAARCSLSGEAWRALSGDGGTFTFVRLRVFAERREIRREYFDIRDFPTVDAANRCPAFATADRPDARRRDEA